MEYVQRPWIRWLLTLGLFAGMAFGNRGIAVWLGLTVPLLLWGEAQAVIRERGRFGLRLVVLSWQERYRKTRR